METSLGQRRGPSLEIGDNNVQSRGIAQEKETKSLQFNHIEVLGRKLQCSHVLHHN